MTGSVQKVVEAGQSLSKKLTANSRVDTPTHTQRFLNGSESPVSWVLSVRTDITAPRSVPLIFRFAHSAL